jgi:hypothetical protein
MWDVFIFFVSAIVAVVFILACWHLPKLATRGYKPTGTITSPDENTLQDNYRKTIAQIAGGAALVLVFSWTFIKDQETLRLNGVQIVNQQFSDAAKLLANNDGKPASAESRAAAIYSLENIINSRSEYYDPVTKTLLSLLQSRSDEIQKSKQKGQEIGLDLKAALYVIGRFPRPKGYLPLDFPGFYLVGGNFSSSVGYERAEFRGAKLHVANFFDAKLVKAKFGGADMADWQSYMDTTGMILTDELTQSKPWIDYIKFNYIASFRKAKLADAVFTAVWVEGVDFREADLARTDFTRSRISRADFTGATNIGKAKFEGACYYQNIKPIGLSDAFLKSNKIGSCPPD